MDFLLSVIDVRGGERGLKRNSFKNSVSFNGLRGTVAALQEFRESCHLGLFPTEVHWSLGPAQQWPRQSKGITGDLRRAAECSGRLSWSPHLFSPSHKTGHVLFSLAHWGAFCPGSWEVFTLVFFLVYQEKTGGLRHSLFQKSPPSAA